MVSMQPQIDQANADFWNELCGSTFAKVHGITKHDLESLNRFDFEYFRYYPYLLKHVPVHTMQNKKVLEVGLGYGTLGLKIAQSGSIYHGLDIAAGPVNMMRHRLGLYGLSGHVVQGSMKACPFPDESMDAVVSIGCFHHTGNIKRCFDETYRVLKKGGSAYVMVYNQRSYRQWSKWPLKTFNSVLRDWSILDSEAEVTLDQRSAYDKNLAGDAAPETVFSSICTLRNHLNQFTSIKFTKEHCEDIPVIPGVLNFPRRFLLNNLGKVLGCDIYLHAVK